MKLFNILLIIFTSVACTSTFKGRELSGRAYYDWSVSYSCGDTNLGDYHDPNQRLCKFWEIMDQGDYLFAEAFINGMKQDVMSPKLIDFVNAHLYIRKSDLVAAKKIVENYSDDKSFLSLRVYLGMEKKFEALGEFNQMELLAKIKANLRIGMTYEAWKLLKTLGNRTRDPWVQAQVKLLKNRKKGEQVT